MLNMNRYLSPHLYDFLEALITQQTSPEEAYRKFDAIASRHTEQLRKCTKQVRISISSFLRVYTIYVVHIKMTLNLQVFRSTI